LTKGREVDVATRLRRAGSDYATDHTGRLPAVVAVRVLRAWDLWKPRSSARLEASIADRNLRVQQVGVVAYWLLVPFAVWGALLMRRRAEPLRVLLAPVALVFVVAVVGYGTTRFRVPAEISIVVLAAYAMAALTRPTSAP
jgi:hypothetical protein